MRNDPDYKSGLDNALGGYEQVTDKAAESLYREGTTIAPEAREWVRNYLTSNFSVNLSP
jgi:hypothetical protein